MKLTRILVLILCPCFVSVAWGRQPAPGGQNNWSEFPKTETSFTVLHSFTGSGFGDGSNPYAGLVRDTAGNLYGTPSSGGKHGKGTAFKVSQTGTEGLMHSFSGGPWTGDIPSLVWSGIGRAISMDTSRSGTGVPWGIAIFQPSCGDLRPRLFLLFTATFGSGIVLTDWPHNRVSLPEEEDELPPAI